MGSFESKKCCFSRTLFYRKSLVISIPKFYLFGDSYVRLQTYHQIIKKDLESASGKWLRGNMDLSHYYDRKEDSNTTEDIEDEDEDESFRYDNEVSSRHSKKDDGDFSNDYEDIRVHEEGIYT